MTQTPLILLPLTLVAHTSALTAEVAFLTAPALSNSRPGAVLHHFRKLQSRPGLSGVRVLQLQASPRGDRDNGDTPSKNRNPLVPRAANEDSARQEDGPPNLDPEAFQMGFRFAEAVNDAQGRFEANYRQGIPVGPVRSQRVRMKNRTYLALLLQILSLGFVALLLSGQLNWLFGVVNFLVLSAIIVPVVAGVALNLWIKNSIVEGECPSCGSEVRDVTSLAADSISGTKHAFIHALHATGHEGHVATHVGRF